VSGALRRRAATLCLLLALPACGPKETVFAVKIVTTACEARVDPFAGVTFIRVRVTGDGLEAPLESVAPATGSRSITIPQIPAGKNRILDVRGYDGDPTAGGKVLSMGRSLPFEVLDTIDPADNDPVAINVFLRKVGAFTQPSSAATPKDCQRMRLPRAAHTATLLKNGKVFVAGGFSFVQGTQTRVPLSEAEFYNPATASFETARELGVGQQKLPKAFHTATRLLSGQVLLWGGESYSGGAMNTASPSAIALIYDPDVNEFIGLPPRKAPEPTAIARTRHKAMIDKNGKVLIVGGETRVAGLVPVDQVEWFDPATNEYKVVSGVTLPRKEPAVAPVKAGDLIAVAGGTDGTAMTNEVVYFKWEATGFKRELLAVPPKLNNPGRRAASAGTLRDGLDLLVLGGYSDPDPAKVTPIASSEIVGTSTTMVTPGPTILSTGMGGRGDICSVQLADGTVMAIGGLAIDAVGAPGRSDGSTAIIKSSAPGTALGSDGPALPVPRYLHSCTLLNDGTVLVLGGLNEQITSHEILQDAWIYQPAPTDP